MEFTVASFSGTLKMALLLQRVLPARADAIVLAASAAFDLTQANRAKTMAFITQIVQQSTVPVVQAAVPTGTQRLTDGQVRLILGPVVRAAIDECAPPFCQVAFVAVWGAPIITLVLDPKMIIFSVRTVERITEIGKELRKRAPITCAAICTGPIPRPADGAIAAAITYVLGAYFARLVRQYLYKVTEEALQAQRAFSSVVPAALLNRILTDLGEPIYVTADIPVGPKNTPAKRDR